MFEADATADRALATPEDHAACVALLRTGSRTFHAAARVLPKPVRQSATALYAFCRVADDAIDGGEVPAEEALRTLRARLDRVYARDPEPHPVDRAFADTVHRHGIPRELPEALLEGFEWDAGGRRYPDLSSVIDYSARVAGTVGAMMAVLMGARAPAVLARACDLGVAMQLTNIARDVGEDARLGRLYLPRDWLVEAGIDPDAWLADPQYSPALGSVVSRLLAVADELYARAATGIASLPAAARPGMHAARLLYAEIGREVERQGLDSVSRRAVVSSTRKARVLSAVLARRLLRAGEGLDHSLPALDETRFLVDAVVRTPAATTAATVVPRRPIEERVIWLVDLFDRLERADRAAAESAARRQPVES